MSQYGFTRANTHESSYARWKYTWLWLVADVALPQSKLFVSYKHRVYLLRFVHSSNKGPF